MTAVIQTEQKGERGQGCVLRMCLLMSRLFAAAASFLEGRAESHWDQHDLERGGAGGQPCGVCEGQSCAPDTPPDADSQAECGSDGDESRTGPNSKGAVSRGCSKRSPAGKDPRNPPRERGAKRRKRKGGKGVDDGPEFMREMAGGLGTTLAMTLLAGLGMKFSKKPNARYGLPDMYRMLLAMCSREGGESSAEGQYQRGRLLECAPDLPSRRRMLDIIKSVRRDYMLTRCRDMATRSMARARRHGMLRRPVDVSIDMHDIPFYARVLGMAYAVFSRYKRGTKRFNRLATLHCVVDGHRLTLGVEVVTREDGGNAPAVRRLLYRARRRGIRMSSITLDRGFHSVDVIEAIKAMGIRMVMPAVKLERVKEIIEKYEAGKRDAISTHTMTNDAGRSTSYTLVVLEREVLKKKYAKMTPEARRLAELHDKDARVKEHYVFATTMGTDWIGGDPHRVAEFYRRRWGIENSYKSYEQMRPRTTSTDYSVRILMWFMPFLLYNIWVLARFLAARRGLVRNGRPPCTLSLFTSMLMDAATMQFAGCTNRHPPD